MEFWLTREDSSSLIIAAPTVRELKRQELPVHVRVTSRKRRGKRVVLRGRRHYYEAYLKTARWPEDGLVESALFSLGCVIRGQADLHIADYILRCKTGDIILFPPGIPKPDSQAHLEDAPPGTVCEILWMHTQFTKADGLRCWICRSEDNTHCSGNELGSCWVPHRFLARLFEGFCDEAQSGRKQAILLHLLSDILLILQDEIERGNVLEEWGRPRYDSKNEEDGPIAEALAYIEENLDQHLTINDVARHVLVSRATFTRRFKEQTGQTFQQYQTALRLKYAREMLLHSEYPILTICNRIGLQHGRFWALFQEKYGCSPSEFRHRKIDPEVDVSG